MSVHEVTWSSFLREPTQVEKWLERGDVLLKRREGATLRLSRETREAAQKEALVAAVRLLVGTASPAESAAFDQATVATRLPWTRFLPPADRERFAAEFLSTLEACADLGEFSALGRLLADWRATASLHADGTASQLTRPLEDFGRKVRRP
jgi:hypothetical protein